MRNILFGLSSIFVLSGCSGFSSGGFEPDYRTLREEWEKKWAPNELEWKLEELPPPIKQVLLELATTKIATNAFLIQYGDEQQAFRIHFNDQSDDYFDSTGTRVRKPAPLRTHGGIL